MSMDLRDRQRLQKHCKREMIDFLLSVYYYFYYYYGRSAIRLVAEPVGRDIGAIQLMGLFNLRRCSNDYFLSRSQADGEDTERPEDLPAKRLRGDVAQVMASLAMPGFVFKTKAVSIAVPVGMLLLQRKGMTSDLSDQTWLQTVNNCHDLTGRSAFDEARLEYARAIRKYWEWSGTPQPRVYDHLHKWARKEGFPWYGDMMQGL